MSRGGTKTLLAAASVSDVLQLGSATVFDADGQLNNKSFTLLSNATQTARISTIPSSVYNPGIANVTPYTSG